MTRLVLASASPRRAAVLGQLGLDVEVRPSSVDETHLEGEAPDAYVERLARLKAEQVAAEVDADLVVGGDTVVVSRGRMLGKPADPDHAVSMLLELAGGTHEVLSGLAIVGAKGTVSAAARTPVHFRSFDAPVARRYAATGEPLDKAGAYGIQGLGAALVEGLDGDYFSVVGFPVTVFIDLLARSGWRYDFGRLTPISSRASPAGDP